jgi:hypothetical protein
MLNEAEVVLYLGDNSEAGPIDSFGPQLVQPGARAVD